MGFWGFGVLGFESELELELECDCESECEFGLGIEQIYNIE